MYALTSIDILSVVVLFFNKYLVTRKVTFQLKYVLDTQASVSKTSL
jgi:hypothetical protein